MSCCRSSSNGSPSCHPQSVGVGWIYLLFLHSWLINMKKSCPLLINFVFHHNNVLMKRSASNSRAGGALFSSSHGSPCHRLLRFSVFKGLGWWGGVEVEDLLKWVPQLEVLFSFPWPILHLSRNVFTDLCSSRQDYGLFI